MITIFSTLGTVILGVVVWWFKRQYSVPNRIARLQKEVENVTTQIIIAENKKSKHPSYSNCVLVAELYARREALNRDIRRLRSSQTKSIFRT
jgi:hypothetical protein